MAKDNKTIWISFLTLILALVVAIFGAAAYTSSMRSDVDYNSVRLEKIEIEQPVFEKRIDNCEKEVQYCSTIIEEIKEDVKEIKIDVKQLLRG